MADSNDTDRPVVLVVEDEPDVAETYELWLSEAYGVRVAEDGPTAIEMVDESVDVVLLDRMMPGMSGSEVLAELRERGSDVRVAMVTAVDPDFDIIEMGFDEYITKPSRREELLGTVEELLERGEYTGRVREYESLVSKRTTLEAEKSTAELEASDEYATLQADIAEVGAGLQADNDRLLDDATFVGTLRDLVDGEGHDAPVGGPDE